MPVARRLPNFELLLDDLVIRLRCLLPPNTLHGRFQQFLGTGNEPHLASFYREAQVWWFSNEMARLDLSSRRLLINELLQRSPSEASIASLALFGGIPFPELNLSDIEHMQGWFEAGSDFPRSTRDALVLRVFTPWFAANPPDLLDRKLHFWLTSKFPCLVRSALVLSVGVIHQSVSSHYTPVLGVLDTIPGKLNFTDREIDLAIGWLLSRVWPIAPELAQKWLANHGSALSRRGFRIAVARIPSMIRQELTDNWKLSR